jgi:hypothetical protein
MGWSTRKPWRRTSLSLDKSNRQDGTFSREDFTYDQDRDIHVCPAGKALKTTRTLVNGRANLQYLARPHDGRSCPLKLKCCPLPPHRKIARAIHE